MGRRFKQRFHRRNNDWFPEEDEDPVSYQRPPNGTCRVQAVRSVSDWSHGVLTEKSIQNACECGYMRLEWHSLTDYVARLSAYYGGKPLYLHWYVALGAFLTRSLIDHIQRINSCQFRPRFSINTTLIDYPTASRAP